MKIIYLLLALSLLFFDSLFAQNNFEKSRTDCPHVGAACTDAIYGKNNGNKILYDGSGYLGPTYNKTACGLNYVQGSVLVQQRSIPYGFNTNGTGLPTSISISRLPSSYVVDKAYLWYIASYFEQSAPNTTVTIINPAKDSSNFNAIRIGTDGNKCWAETGTSAYRVDITSSIVGNGLYIINITGFDSASKSVDGATLMIIYRDTSATYQGSLNIWDGIMTSGGSNGYPATEQVTLTNLNVCANSTYANAFLIVSDMQANVNGRIHQTTLNGSLGNYSNDFYNFDIANINLTAGQNSSYFGTNGQSIDCFSVCAAGLYYQTESCTSCPLISSLTELGKSQHQIKVFPNPSNGSFIAEFNSPVKDAELIIYDLPGKEILRRKFNGTKTEIQKPDLASGVYFVRVLTEERSFTEKLIVR